jgi:hypothetical protein
MQENKKWGTSIQKKSYNLYISEYQVVHTFHIHETQLTLIPYLTISCILSLQNLVNFLTFLNPLRSLCFA